MTKSVWAIGAIVTTAFGAALGVTPSAAQRPALPASPQSGMAAGVPRGVALTGVTVVDVRTGRLHPEQTVVVAGRRIRAVGSAARVRVPAGVQVVDARGQYLIPGLWDMELYLGTFSMPLMRLLIANGVTGIRHLGQGGGGVIGGQHITVDSILRWRREVAAGTRVGPRLLIGGSLHNEACGATCTPERARFLADSVKAAGADHVFVYHSLSRAIALATLAEARRRHIPVVGHLPTPLTLVEASDSGLHAVDHLMGTGGYCFDRVYSVDPAVAAPESASVAKCRALAARLRRNSTWVAIGPTLSLGLRPPSRLTELEIRRRLRCWPRRLQPDSADLERFLDRIKSWQEQPPKEQQLPRDFFALAERAGLPMLMATDQGANRNPTPVGFKLHDDLAIAVEHGLRPLTALQAVTLNAARYLMNGTDSLGTVEAGKLADLVLLAGNPLENIYHTQRIRAVVADGRYYDRAALDRLLAEAGAAQ